jgi:hypothetical protein
MLTTLREVSKRGAPIIVLKPLRERGLERFTSPQHPVEMLSLNSRPIWKLEAALKCRSCKKGCYAPPVHMIKLTATQIHAIQRGSIPMRSG